MPESPQLVICPQSSDRHFSYGSQVRIREPRKRTFESAECLGVRLSSIRGLTGWNDSPAALADNLPPEAAIQIEFSGSTANLHTAGIVP